MSSFASVVVALLVKEYGTGDVADACPKAHNLALTLMDLIQDAEKGNLYLTVDEMLEIDEEKCDPTWLLPHDTEAEDVNDSEAALVKKEKIPWDAVFNGDQSGFVKEMHGARSLAVAGQRSVFRVVNSVAATTHSSTVLPQISAAGSLRPKLFVVLQEPGGKFPDKGHFTANNLVVYAHSSHIMTKGLMIQWLKEAVFTDDLPPRSLLILDSWNPFLDHAKIQKHVPKKKKVFVMNIPPGCTAKFQPLDVFFFIHVKRFMKRITSHAQLQGIDFVVHRRDNLLKALSQIFWIFANPRFSGFLRYPWSAAGYTAHPGNFETPADYAFNLEPDCENVGCDNISFIRCPDCTTCHCFECFVIKFHRCSQR